MAPLSPHQFPQITTDEARGDSQAVTPERFQKLASQGKTKLEGIRAASGGPAALHDTGKLSAIKNDAWKAVKEPWGGGTYNANTGQKETPKKGYSLTTRDPGTSQISMPLNVSREQFDQHIERAASEQGHMGTHLGVFHDADKGTIDVDPTVIVGSKSAVHSIGAHTHAVGGAYDFSTGNGVWVPHVKGSGNNGV